MVSQIRRNETCATFLSNNGFDLTKETKINKKYNYQCIGDPDSLEAIVSEYERGRGIAGEITFVVEDPKTQGKVELKAEDKSFVVHLHYRSGNAERSKSIKADRFIWKFESVDEYYVYLTDFMNTLNEWFNENRLVEENNVESIQIQSLNARIEDLEDEITELRGFVLDLIEIVEVLNGKGNQ